MLFPGHLVRPAEPLPSLAAISITSQLTRFEGANWSKSKIFDLTKGKTAVGR
jgi:hypothetical protein